MNSLNVEFGSQGFKAGAVEHKGRQDGQPGKQRDPNMPGPQEVDKQFLSITDIRRQPSNQNAFGPMKEIDEEEQHMESKSILNSRLAKS